MTPEFMRAIAKGAGVKDLARWNRERQSAAVVAEVKKTTAEANRLGFEGTPSFAVEGPTSHGLKTIGFPESAGELEEAIDSAKG